MNTNDEPRTGGVRPSQVDEIGRRLDRMSDQLDRAQRRAQQHDFSVLRLLGAVLQMFAIVAAACGVVGLWGDQDSGATARLTLACFLQLASMSAFAVDRFR